MQEISFTLKAKKKPKKHPFVWWIFYITDNLPSESLFLFWIRRDFYFNFFHTYTEINFLAPNCEGGNIADSQEKRSFHARNPVVKGTQSSAKKPCVYLQKSHNFWLILYTDKIPNPELIVHSGWDEKNESRCLFSSSHKQNHW